MIFSQHFISLASQRLNLNVPFINSALSTMADATVEINPRIIYFTFSRIRPMFSCGRTIDETLQALISGKQSVEDLPRISLLFDGANYYSLNNRRLYVFKALQDAGVVSTIPARLKAVPNTKRMREKYSPAKCSLEARLMPERPAGERLEDGDEPDECEEDDVEVECEAEPEGAEPQKQPATAPSTLSKAVVPPKAQTKQQPSQSLRGPVSLADELAQLSLGANDDSDTPQTRATNSKKKKKR
jgi:hypothetical protein